METQINKKEKRKFNPRFVPRPYGDFKIPLSKSHFKYWDLEIGSGDGRFSLDRALKHTHRQMIAIEKTKNKIRKIKYKGDLPSNLHFIHTNAVWWVTHFVPKNFLDCIFILYPNVYVKKKHSNLRWVNRPFMSFLLERLKVGGSIEIRTNHFNYYLETKEGFTNQFPFMSLQRDEEIKNISPQTTFEEKYLSSHSCLRLKYIKER